MREVLFEIEVHPGARCYNTHSDYTLERVSRMLPAEVLHALLRRTPIPTDTFEDKVRKKYLDLNDMVAMKYTHMCNMFTESGKSKLYADSRTVFATVWLKHPTVRSDGKLRLSLILEVGGKRNTPYFASMGNVTIPHGDEPLIDPPSRRNPRRAAAVGM